MGKLAFCAVSLQDEARCHALLRWCAVRCVHEVVGINKMYCSYSLHKICVETRSLVHSCARVVCACVGVWGVGRVACCVLHVGAFT